MSNSTVKLIKDQEKEGRAVFLSFDGLHSVDVEAWIQQPVDGLLYDLNRDRVTAITWLAEGDGERVLEKNHRWVNNYAVALVIRALKAKIDELEKALEEEHDSNMS